ncbi:MAG TPA: L,D-transpeptidase family protein [Polyangia bacterium]|jgi:murein L,D-transpeptidase YafK|nr:L,D-transpeptidase family protein [Polyangia bacterium]
MSLVVLVARALTVMSLFVLAPSARAAPPPSACRPGETAVVVELQAHRLTLCAGGRVEGELDVALGTGGVGKRVAGDDRTPVGVYGLGAPRASRHYHLFVPVEYPTPAQRRLGFTGGAIGIHGPPRGYEWVTRRAPTKDWTAGCIALATDAQIELLATWIHDRAVHRVRLG